MTPNYQHRKTVYRLLPLLAGLRTTKDQGHTMIGLANPYVKKMVWTYYSGAEDKNTDIQKRHCCFSLGGEEPSLVHPEPKKGGYTD
jgi:hypothetical protein